MGKDRILSKTKLYKVWDGMKTRCNNKNYHSYKNYGGKGITICNEWLKDYMNFHKWAISKGYSEGLTIDRINNNEGYNPENCRWVDIKTQNRNRSINKKVTIKGQTKTISEWAEETGINYGTLISRYNRGEIDENKFLRKSRSSKASNNKTGYKGVHYEKKINKWKAVFNKDGKFVYLGYYNSAHEAGRIYRKYIVNYYRTIENIRKCNLQQLNYLSRYTEYRYVALYEIDRRLYSGENKSDFKGYRAGKN